VILWTVRWYLMFPISNRDLEPMRLDRSVEGDHTTIFRWTQACAAELEKRIRPHLRRSNGSLRVDERYEKVKGRWVPVSSDRQPWPFFRRVLVRPHRINPRTITVDKNAAYPKAMAEMRQDGERWHRSRLRQVKCLNNIVEQDHRNVKRLTRPSLGFGGFWAAR
jgi:IS6 family transposase